ncbi:MAG: hypothetical protein Kow0059_19260 [Candidatus Sumerlaeia bacterium]
MCAEQAAILNFVRQRVRLFDGGTGSKLFALGWRGEDKCPEAAPPEIVTRIHADYLEAGAEFLTTNTFGGTRHKLQNFGLGDRTAELNRRNARLAREAAGRAAAAPRPFFVAGDLGPTGLLPEPYGEATFEDFYNLFKEQAEALLEGEVDLFIVETMSAAEELQAAVRAAKDLAPDVPVIGSMTFQRTPQGFRTMMGVSPAEAVACMREAGCDIVGSNCTMGPADFVGLVGELVEAAGGLPVLAEPNAGQPRLENGRTVYCLADGWEAHARAILDAGAQLIGGCCGTDERYIRTLRSIVDGRA